MTRRDRIKRCTHKWRRRPTGYGEPNEWRCVFCDLIVYKEPASLKGFLGERIR